MTVWILLASIIVLILAPGVSAGASQNPPERPLGFIATESQSPIQQLRFGLQHYPPWVLPANGVKLYFEHNWKNLWMYEPGYYIIDAEVHELALRSCFGLGKGFLGSIQVPVRYTSGGILDGLIEGFHELFRLGDQKRELFARNKFVFGVNPTGTPDGWQYAGSEQIGWNLGNTVLALNYAIPGAEERGYPTIISANLKLPTGTRRDYFGDQSVDVGMSVTTARRFGPIWAYFSPGVVYYSQDEIIGIAVRQWHFSNLTAVEYHPQGSRHSWIAQWMIESPVAKDFSQFSDFTFELMFGYKYRINEKSVFEFGFLENLFYFDNSPDIGFHFGITRSLHF